MNSITICLWFDSRAEEAARFYTELFKRAGKSAEIGDISKYDEAAANVAGKKPGSVLTVNFELDGQNFMALNGGPDFKFNESISLLINCESQEEVDYFWEKMTEEGEEGQCGWLKDKYGVSWQVVPKALGKIMTNGDEAKTHRATEALLKMKKIEIEELEKA